MNVIVNQQPNPIHASLEVSFLQFNGTYSQINVLRGKSTVIYFQEGCIES